MKYCNQLAIEHGLACCDSARDMNWEHLPETRREPIHGGSTPASMRVTVSGRCSQSMSLQVNGTAMRLYSRNNELVIISC